MENGLEFQDLAERMKCKSKILQFYNMKLSKMS